MRTEKKIPERSRSVLGRFYCTTKTHVRKLMMMMIITDPRTLNLLTIQGQSYQIVIKEHVPRFQHYSYVMPLLWTSRSYLTRQGSHHYMTKLYRHICHHICPNNLLFFWPCIMNWPYIDYQLDALIIIYSWNNILHYRILFYE